MQENSASYLFGTSSLLNASDLGTNEIVTESHLLPISVSSLPWNNRREANQNDLQLKFHNGSPKSKRPKFHFMHKLRHLKRKKFKDSKERNKRIRKVKNDKGILGSIHPQTTEHSKQLEVTPYKIDLNYAKDKIQNEWYTIRQLDKSQEIITEKEINTISSLPRRNQNNNEDIQPTLNVTSSNTTSLHSPTHKVTNSDIKIQLRNAIVSDDKTKDVKQNYSRFLLGHENGLDKRLNLRNSNSDTNSFTNKETIANASVVQKNEDHHISDKSQKNSSSFLRHTEENVSIFSRKLSHDGRELPLISEGLTPSSENNGSPQLTLNGNARESTISLTGESE